MGGDLVSPRAPDAVYSDQRWRKRNKMWRRVRWEEKLRYFIPLLTFSVIDQYQAFEQRQVTLMSSERLSEIVYYSSKYTQTWCILYHHIFTSYCRGKYQWEYREQSRWKCQKNLTVQPIQSFVPTEIFSLLQGNCEGRIQHSVQQFQEKNLLFHLLHKIFWSALCRCHWWFLHNAAFRWER